MSDEDSPLPPSEIVQSLATRDDYAAAIREAYRDTVEGIFRMGGLLIEAKRELPHGEFGPMVEADLPFGKRAARMLMSIARDERLTNRKRVSDLPPAWSTLYQLTTLDDSEFAAVEPHISPDMNRSDIPEFVAKGSQLSLASPDQRSARERTEAALRNLPAAERNWVRRKLQDVPPLERARIARTLAEADPEDRERLIELDEELQAPSPERREEAVQLVLPGIADHAREELLDGDQLDDPQMEGARFALALQALIRWGDALAERSEPEAVLDGLWAVRDPEKVVEDARSVAEWMGGMAAEMEFERALRRAEPRD